MSPRASVGPNRPRQAHEEGPAPQEAAGEGGEEWQERTASPELCLGAEGWHADEELLQGEALPAAPPPGPSSSPPTTGGTSAAEGPAGSRAVPMLTVHSRSNYPKDEALWGRREQLVLQLLQA